MDFVSVDEECLNEFAVASDFSQVGYLFQVIGQLTITHTGVGRVLFSFNFVFLCLYLQMAFLTYAYNQRLEYPDNFFEVNRYAM